MSPWSGRLRHENGSTSSSAVDKGKKKVEGIGIIGYESLSSESLDEELGIPVLRTLGVSRAGTRDMCLLMLGEFVSRRL